MNEVELQDMLLAGLGDCQVEIQADGNRIGLTLIGNVFEGLNRVKRSQLVYAIVDSKIKSGEIHAVSMQCLTVNEAKN